MKRCIKCFSYAFNLYKEDIDQGDLCDVHYWKEKAMEAQPAVALEQRSNEHLEPVAYFNPQVKGGFYWAKPTNITAPITVSVEPMPLYTTQPQRKPLTDEQIEAIAEEFGVGGWICDFARAIEAELKEENDC